MRNKGRARMKNPNLSSFFACYLHNFNFSHAPLGCEEQFNSNSKLDICLTCFLLFSLRLVTTVEEQADDAVTEQYSILFISAGVCVAVFIVFLGVLCFR